jgi:ribosomal protein L40E
LTDLSQIFIFILAFFGLFFGLAIVLVLVVNRADRGKKSKSVEQNSEIKEKETIIKEVVMIPCMYCGALTPQTAIFCSNCGASRKTN